MGHDKRLARLGDRPLIAHAIDRLAPQVDRLMINANDDPSNYAATGFLCVPIRFPILPDPWPAFLPRLLWAQEIDAAML